MLPATLCGLFNMHTNDTSVSVETFYRLLVDIALVGTHVKCTNPVAYFLSHGYFKSERDRIKQAFSKRRRASIAIITQPALKALLRELHIVLPAPIQSLA